jgi:hypothetical protein
MLEECRHPGYQTLQTGMNMLIHRLVSWERSLLRLLDTREEGTDRTLHRPASCSIGLRSLCGWSQNYHWRRLLYHICRIVRKQIFEPWGPELRCFTVYWLERMSLLLSSATIAESLYGGKRVKLESRTETSNYSTIQNQRQRRLRPLMKQDAI